MTQNDYHPDDRVGVFRIGRSMRDEQAIQKVRRSVATVPWDGLAHAYPAAADAPENLEVILRSGGPVYEAWVSNALPMNSDDEDDQQYFKASVVTKRQLQALIRHSMPVIRASLDHSDGATRTAAVAAGLGALQMMPKEAAPLGELVNVIGSSHFDPGEWVSAAMVLGELGHDFSALLEHADRRLRLAAAMSSSTFHDPRSIAELASAVSEPEWLEAEFPGGAAHLDMHLRFHVLAVLLDRVKASEATNTVVAAICTLIRKRAHPYTTDLEWAPVLHWAFCERVVSLPHEGALAPLPDVPTQTQAAILRVLCDKPDLWDRRNGNADLAFKRVQLPFDRLRLRRFAGDDS